MPRETTGRCHPCRVRYVWTGLPLLRDALCPYCGATLKQTTHLWRGASSADRPRVKER